MAKRSPKAKAEFDTSSSHGTSPVARVARWKWAVSALLIFHLLAVLAEPFAFFTRGADAPSPLAMPIRSTLAPYVEFGYLNHGYFFFAPNPGPSHLLECQLKSNDGQVSRLRLPDLKAQWPRLLYHRHFMLAEFLHQLHVPPITEEIAANTPDKELLRNWQIERNRFEMVRSSMIHHLKVRYGVDTAEIQRLEHRLPSDVEVFRERMRLNDERLYVVLPDVPLDPTVPQPLGPFPNAPAGAPNGPLLNAPPLNPPLRTSPTPTPEPIELNAPANGPAETGPTEAGPAANNPTTSNPAQTSSETSPDTSKGAIEP